MNRFENKVAVITGAAGGIGEATTQVVSSPKAVKLLLQITQKKGQTNLLPN